MRSSKAYHLSPGPSLSFSSSLIIPASHTLICSALIFVYFVIFLLLHLFVLRLFLDRAFSFLPSFTFLFLRFNSFVFRLFSLSFLFVPCLYFIFIYFRLFLFISSGKPRIFCFTSSFLAFFAAPSFSIFASLSVFTDS